jgi:hypothetical protein
VAYIPSWQSLGETLARVMACGDSMSEAKRDICRALSDGKLHPRYWVGRVQTSVGAEVSRRLFGYPRSPSDLQDIIGRPCVPADLAPTEIDWKNSRPKGPWLDGRGFLVGIGKIEVSTAEVIRVLCRDRPGKPASDALLGGSSAGLEVQPPEPLAPPETDVASADQVAGLEVQPPEPLAPPEIDVASADQVAPPPHRRSRKRNRVQRAIDETYPGGVPEEITDMELFAAVGGKLGANTPSLETVRRAAGRRSK